MLQRVQRTLSTYMHNLHNSTTRRIRQRLRNSSHTPLTLDRRNPRRQRHDTISLLAHRKARIPQLAQSTAAIADSPMRSQSLAARNVVFDARRRVGDEKLVAGRDEALRVDVDGAANESPAGVWETGGVDER